MASATITEFGDKICSGLASGISTVFPKYGAWGTGSQTTPKTANALATETTTTNDPGYARPVTANTQQTNTYTDDTAQFLFTLTAGATLAITEAGIFDALTAGNMFEYASFAAVNLASGDAIQFTFEAIFD